MFKRLTLFRWLVVGLTVGSWPVSAIAQCVIFEKPEDLFANNQVVFRGTVVAKQATGTRGEHVIVEIATFQVQQTWKGEPGRRVQVGADRPFELGREYLVFATGKPLGTSILCRAAEPVDQAKAKLEWLSKIKKLANTPLQPTSGGRVDVE